MKHLLAILFFVCSGSILLAQEQDNIIDIIKYPANNIYSDVPAIEIETENLNLMKAFFPLYYDNEQKIRQDIRYVERNDSALIATWDSLSGVIMTTITSLSGIEWVEDNLQLHLMKFLPVDKIYDPASIPLEGIKTPEYIEAAPSGLQRLMNMIVIFSGRNIQQIFNPISTHHHLFDHPLLQQSAYRFDVLSLTLAMAVSQYIIMPDSLERIVNSENWRRHNPGWETYSNHFRHNWALTAEKPLIVWLTDEPYNSPLVELTRPPRIIEPRPQKETPQEPIKFSAGGGRLGFSVIKNLSGFLEVADVDTLGLGYACGLRAGDLIKKVNGEVIDTPRNLMGKIIDKIDTDGVYMIIMRNDQELGILLLPKSVIE